MIFSYNWLQSFFDKKIPAPEKLADVLTAHSFEVKELKEVKTIPGVPSENQDKILNIDVLPNRAHDCFAHIGVAKEISALLNIPLKPAPKQKWSVLKGKTEELLELKVEEPVLCRRYIAGIMTNVNVAPSPKWMQERLIAVGQKPINNIVDCANYVMLEIGQPLHAFDFDKLETKKIIVRRAKKGEKITTLDNREVNLDENILIIADSKEPLAIAGIKGGRKAEISQKTKNIVVESANFEPKNVRLSSQKIGLKTGASVGFENEISPYLAEIAIGRVMSLIRETAGGEAVGENIDFYPKKFAPPRIIFKPADVSKLLGISVPEKKIISILRKLYFEVKKATRLPARQKGAIVAVGPAERLDLNIKEDVIEEIARIIGYDKIPAKAPEGLLIPPPRNDAFFYENVIRDILAGAGFSEVYNYSFAKLGEVEIENPIAIDKKYLRMNLWQGLTANAAQNLKYFDEIKIFEIGKFFRKAGGKIIEKKSLAGLVVYNKSKGKEEFYEIKGVLEILFSRLGIGDFWLNETSANEGSQIQIGIKVGQETVGVIRRRNDFEIDLEQLISIANEEVEFRPISKYPAVIRDIAVLVPKETRMTEVSDIIDNTGGELLMDVDLFDVFEGDEVGENMKNFAFHLIFQSPEKTLSDKEVNAIMDKIIKALDGVKEWEVRK